MAVIVQNHGRPCGACRDMKMRPMQRSPAHTSKSFGPQSMAPRRFLFVCLSVSAVIRTTTTRGTRRPSPFFGWSRATPGGQNAFSRGACYPPKISVNFGGRPNYLSDIHAGPGNWRLQLIFCVTPILPPQIQRHSQNTIPLIQSLFSKLFRWDLLFDVVVGRHEERNV